MEVSDRPSDAQDKTAYCIFWFFKIGLLEQCIYKRDVDNFHAQIDLLQVEPCKSVALAWVTLGLLGLCFLQWKCSAVCGWSASSTSLVLLLAGNGHLHPCSFLCPYNITYSSSSMSVTSHLYCTLIYCLYCTPPSYVVHVALPHESAEGKICWRRHDGIAWMVYRLAFACVVVLL